MATSTPAVGLTAPRFPRELALPEGTESDFRAAATAIQHEHRASSEWKCFQCVQVVPVDPEEGLFRLDTSVELGLDSWEGSTALRYADAAIPLGEDAPESTVWSGAVVEADDVRGSLYIALEHGEAPRRGTFYVRPFEFTAILNRIYTDEAFTDLRPLLESRLRACEGGVCSDQTLPPPWSAGWNLLWGPPGTGKTRLLGERVAELLRDPSERVLVVSTTNDATDSAALSVARAARPLTEREPVVVRVGRGARYRRYQEEQLESLLQTQEHRLRTEIEAVRHQLDRERSTSERARIRQRLGVLVRELKGSASAAVRDIRRRVVITTSFHALTFAAERDLLDATSAPFTTVVVDEAGLLSRVTLAAISLLAARRVVLVGDPKQLAPISRMSRVLPTEQSHWLGRSALHHLKLEETGPGREFLTHQFRMHPEIRAAISAYQYGGQLEDASGKAESVTGLPVHRAIWYVLDEDRCERYQLRADRGPQNRSWVRPHTSHVLGRLFSTYPELAAMQGLFLSPFVGQCRAIADYLSERSHATWRSSTVHQQQGAEADVVVFDTVNAGSHCWPSDEWERLINVAISRARSLVIVLATRDEMSQPFLAPLLDHLWPAALRYAGKTWSLTQVDPKAALIATTTYGDADPRLGAQIARRKALRPILSAEQQRLCQLELDGRARLVRGVAGSGKTVVLAHWVVQTYLRLRAQKPRLWVVFANAALGGLISETINAAWTGHGQSGSFPRDAIVLQHIDHLLTALERPERAPSHLRFEYGKRAAALLASGRPLPASCDALFLDEAQDLGAATIKLLSQLVKQTDLEDERSRAINIFYDNAQNVYGRGTPKWVDLGIDVRGRSVVMKESFRSTRPIIEFAINLLARLTVFGEDPDQREYIERGFVKAGEREDGKPWWTVHFNEIGGPTPRFRKFSNRQRELDQLSRQVREWVVDEKVAPNDIVIVTMGKDGSRQLGELIAMELTRMLTPFSVRSEFRTTEGFVRDGRTVVVTTPHSFKGYEAELVYVPGVDQFAHADAPLTAPLYVALTRARSVLVASGIQTSGPGAQIVAAMREVSDLAGVAPAVDDSQLASTRDIENFIGRRLGGDLEPWLKGVATTHELVVDAVLDTTGEVIAEPLFIARSDSSQVAFYAKDSPPNRTERFRLEDAGFAVHLVGEPLVSAEAGSE